MSFNRSEFIDFVTPPGNRLKLYDSKSSPLDQPRNDAADPAKSVPQGFIDAMTVREEVYVKEQNIPIENELDEDDARSFHWVAYASVPSGRGSASKGNDRRQSTTSTKLPIGTIRLVPPPHPPHPNGKEETSMHDGIEAYLKLGRLAVIKEFRKTGVSRLLIETALSYARQNPYKVLPRLDPTKVEAAQQDGTGVGLDWKGLVLVHSQVGVQKVWKRYGFELDQEMGEWDEEGIQHVGMWKRMDVTDGRRKSRVWLPSAASG